jgi:tetratricopeptide (TPR) repeat protein
VTSFVLTAPKTFMPEIYKIAVLDFDGNAEYGRFISDQIIGALLQENRGIPKEVSTGFLKKTTGATLLSGATTRIYDIVERSTVETVLQEQSFSNSGYVNPDQAASFGKILGVDAIIVGDYDVNSSTARTYEEVKYIELKRQYTKTVECLTRITSATVSVRVIGVETAQVLSTYSNTNKAEDKKCADDLPKLASESDQARTCLVAHANAFASSIAPVFSVLSIELEKITASQFKEQAEKAAKYAEALDVDNAYLRYLAIYKRDEYNPAVLFNMGALNEVVGNYEKAIKFYITAFQLQDNKKFKTAIIRAKSSKTLSDNLASLGISIAPHVFNTSAEAISNAAAKKITVKGKQQDRVSIKIKPSNNSQDLTRVPGGIQLKVLASAKGWYCVELPGNKKGYIHSDFVKR